MKLSTRTLLFSFAISILFLTNSNFAQTQQTTGVEVVPIQIGSGSGTIKYDTKKPRSQQEEGVKVHEIAVDKKFIFGKIDATLELGSGNCEAQLSVSGTNPVKVTPTLAGGTPPGGVAKVEKYDYTAARDAQKIYVIVAAAMNIMKLKDCSNTYKYTVYIKNYRLPAITSCNLPGNNQASPSANEAQLSDDSKFNGQFFSYDKSSPKAKNYGDSGQDSVFFVNGINTNLTEAKETALRVSEVIAHPVDLIYNNSSSDVAIDKTRTTYQGNNLMLWVKSNLLNNPPAANTLADHIIERLSQNKKVDIVAYSQGAAITAAALKQVKKCLTSNRKSLDIMSNIRVLSIGGAAGQKDFPDNTYISTLEHRSDNIPILLGDNMLLNAKDLDFKTQHTNYFKKETGEKGDPKAESLLKKWYKDRADFDEILDDIP